MSCHSGQLSTLTIVRMAPRSETSLSQLDFREDDLLRATVGQQQLRRRPIPAGASQRCSPRNYWRPVPLNANRSPSIRPPETNRSCGGSVGCCCRYRTCPFREPPTPHASAAPGTTISKELKSIYGGPQKVRMTFENCRDAPTPTDAGTPRITGLQRLSITADYRHRVRALLRLLNGSLRRGTGEGRAAKVSRWCR